MKRIENTLYIPFKNKKKKISLFYKEIGKSPVKNITWENVKAKLCKFYLRLVLIQMHHSTYNGHK